MRSLTTTILLLLMGTQASGVPLANPGFEDITGESPSNEFTFGPLNGWDLYDPGNITQGGEGATYFIGTLTPNPPTNFTDGAAEGQRVAIAFNFFGSGGLGEYGLEQTSSESLLPNTAYRLSVEVGNIASGTAVSGQDFDLEGFPGYRIDLFAGGQLMAQDDNTLAGSIPEGEFATSIRTFTTGPSTGAGLLIQLINLNEIDPAAPDANLEVDFDDVRLELVGDLDADGFVGITDLNLILSAWNQAVNPGDLLLGDPSGDGFVGIEDLNLVLAHWNAGAPPAHDALPEPASLSLLVLGAITLSGRRIR